MLKVLVSYVVFLNIIFDCFQIQDYLIFSFFFKTMQNSNRCISVEKPPAGTNQNPSSASASDVLMTEESSLRGERRKPLPCLSCIFSAGAERW